MKIPQKYLNYIGTKQRFLGDYLFSYNKKSKGLSEGVFLVKDCKFGTAKIIDMSILKPIHPTVIFLLKNDNMKRAQWTKPFPVSEISL